MKADAAKRIMLAQSLGNIKGEVSPEAQKVRDEAMQEIMLTLWDTDELKDLIRKEHGEHCRSCPVRVRYEHERLEEENRAKTGEGKAEWKELAWKLLKIVAFVTVAAMAILGKIHGTDVVDASECVQQMQK